MDLTRKVNYRGFALNTIQFDAETRDMVGCEVTRVQYGHVLGVGYDEKRALGEGRDASDVWLDQRLISLQGNVYGRTRPEAMDRFDALAAALSPTDAYGEDPSNKGFLPLDFYTPTLLTSEWPTGVIHRMMLVRPMATPGALFASDNHGGEDNQALAIPWDAQLHAKDPRILNVAYTTTPLNGAMNGGGTVRNRGNRPAVVEVNLVIPDQVNTGGPGQFKLHIAGAASIIISLPRSSAQHTIRYDTGAKVLAYDDDLRMDFLTFGAGPPHGQLSEGSHSYTWEVTGTKQLLAGSYFRFRDTWA